MKKLYLTKHALERIYERQITPDECNEVLAKGTEIELYPDDKPFPSKLIAGKVRDKNIHIVISEDNNNCYLITAYKPDPKMWDEYLIKRRKK